MADPNRPWPDDDPIAYARGSPAKILAMIAGFWVVSDLGYYFGLPWMGISPSYNDSAVQISIFYVFWIGLAGIAFFPVYISWRAQSPWPAFHNRLQGVLIWIAGFAAAAWYLTYVMPTIEPVAWPSSFGPAPDILMATPDYFLPKTMEILFQQLLVLALILTLAARGLPLWKVGVYCAALFGGMHVLLFLSDTPTNAVVRYIIGSALFASVMPWIILRLRYGLALTIAIHWAFYAVIIILAQSHAPDNIAAGIGS